MVQWTQEQRDWARERLERFVAACERYDQDQKARRYDGIDEGLYNEMIRQEPTTKRIIAELDPNLADINVRNYLAGASTAAGNAHAALAILSDLDEVERHLGPTGPIVSADDLHQWIWGPAASFWDAGRCAVAVDQAAKSLTAHIQKKSGSSLVDRELAAEVFSAKETAGRTRLWLPGDRSTATWRSRQDGLHLLSQGAYAGIRNVVVHSHEPQWSEQEALEYLAVLSTVARWTDETESTTASQPCLDRRHGACDQTRDQGGLLPKNG